jgi:Ser/Thr protein kinase RdoA (MazF antagonist)
VIPASAWGWDESAVTPLAGGLINETYVVHAAGAPIAVLQRLHPIFAPDVNLDLEAVTAHVAARGMTTPRLIRTTSGDAWASEGGHTWRALTWVDGESVPAVPAPAWAEAGGALVGEFHRAVADLSYDYRFTRAGVHDTRAHLAKLAEHVAANGPAALVELGREIGAAASALPPLPALPRRHVHGDLKISNVLFRRAPLEAPASPALEAIGRSGEAAPRAIALVDLDTLAKGTMAFELGDAMRSWCNPHGEDAGHVRFELPIFEAAIRGFRGVADALVTRDELIGIVSGLETVCIELAARFAVDAFEDRYFGWDPARFSSRREHNVVRARGQLALGLAVRAARGDALDVVLKAR